MDIFALLLLAVGLSMDAFAVAVCKGLALKKEMRARHALLVGFYFGLFQALMPAIGYLIGMQFAGLIQTIDHWVAFALLGFIGAKMMAEGIKNKESAEESCNDSLSPKKMLPLAVATSIDALAVGISFAFLNVRILPAVLCIGMVTFVISAAGVRVGSAFGGRMKNKAEIAGGALLILLGLKILWEHLA